jgi:hypothetical protein
MGKDIKRKVVGGIEALGGGKELPYVLQKIGFSRPRKADAELAARLLCDYGLPPSDAGYFAGYNAQRPTEYFKNKVAREYILNSANLGDVRHLTVVDLNILLDMLKRYVQERKDELGVDEIAKLTKASKELIESRYKAAGGDYIWGGSGSGSGLNANLNVMVVFAEGCEFGGKVVGVEAEEEKGEEKGDVEEERGLGDGFCLGVEDEIEGMSLEYGIGGVEEKGGEQVDGE